MRRILLVVALWALCCAAASPHVVRGETHHDEQLLSSRVRTPLPPYESLDGFGRGYCSRDLYERVAWCWHGYPISAAAG